MPLVQVPDRAALVQKLVQHLDVLNDEHNVFARQAEDPIPLSQLRARAEAIADLVLAVQPKDLVVLPPPAPARETIQGLRMVR